MPQMHTRPKVTLAGAKDMVSSFSVRSAIKPWKRLERWLASPSQAAAALISQIFAE
jgi:hypothetical protein